MIRKTACLLIVFALTSTSWAAAPRAVDGDTIEVDREIIRVLNIDAPEIHQAKCPAERQRGLDAKRRMGQLLTTGRITLLRGDGRRMKDRYGRTLARVIINGRDIGEQLIGEGLVRPWTGKRRPWCN